MSHQISTAGLALYRVQGLQVYRASSLGTSGSHTSSLSTHFLLSKILSVVHYAFSSTTLSAALSLFGCYVSLSTLNKYHISFISVSLAENLSTLEG
jgi:hypothetical protein